MSRTANATGAGLLVIGCGNTLRGDDAAGFEVARSVEEWGLANVRALPVHQLTPELAEELATAAEVVFVDASSVDRTLRAEELDGCHAGAVSESALAHSMAPAALLSFTKLLYGCAPRAWVVGIPAFSFDDADSITPSTLQSMDEVYAWIRNRVRAQHTEPLPCMN